MLAPMRRALEADPAFFCGQIIFQKDGCNMARRTPVAFALGEQLKLLRQYGYRVVTVEELLRESPFADVAPDDPLLPKLRALAAVSAVAFTDNRVRPDQPMTNGELAMLLAPKHEAMSAREAMIRASGKSVHPYAGAMKWCAEHGLLPAGAAPDAPLAGLPDGRFEPVRALTRRAVYEAYRQ